MKLRQAKKILCRKKNYFWRPRIMFMLMAWAKTTESQRLSVGLEPIRRKEVRNESKICKEDTSRTRQG